MTRHKHDRLASTHRKWLLGAGARNLHKILGGFPFYGDEKGQTSVHGSSMQIPVTRPTHHPFAYVKCAPKQPPHLPKVTAGVVLGYIIFPKILEKILTRKFLGNNSARNLLCVKSIKINSASADAAHHPVQGTQSALDQVSAGFIIILVRVAE